MSDRNTHLEFWAVGPQMRWGSQLPRAPADEKFSSHLLCLCSRWVLTLRGLPATGEGQKQRPTRKQGTGSCPQDSLRFLWGHSSHPHRKCSLEYLWGCPVSTANNRVWAECWLGQTFQEQNRETAGSLAQGSLPDDPKWDWPITTCVWFKLYFHFILLSLHQNPRESILGRVHRK